MQINIEKRHFTIIVVLLLFLTAISLIIAASSKPNPGHNSDEVYVNWNSKDMNLQTAMDSVQAKINARVRNVGGGDNCEWVPSDKGTRLESGEVKVYCPSGSVLRGISGKSTGEYHVDYLRVYCCKLLY